MVRQSNADEFEANARPGLQPWFATSLAATKQTQSPGIFLCETCENTWGFVSFFDEGRDYRRLIPWGGIALEESYDTIGSVPGKDHTA